MSDATDDAYSRLLNDIIDSMRPAPTGRGQSVVATGDKDPLTNAREYFNALKENKWAVMTDPDPFNPLPIATDDPTLILIALRRSMAMAGVSASAVVPAKSDDDAEQEIRNAVRANHIRVAREDFASLGNYYKEYKPIEAQYEPLRFAREHSIVDRESVSIEQTLPNMRMALQEAGVDASALDPSGKKTAREMEGEIAKATSRGFIVSARENLAMAITGIADVPDLAPDFIKSAREDLAKAGADASALDPEGKKSAAEMGAYLDRLSKEANIARARFVYAEMQKDIARLPREKGLDADVTQDSINWDRERIQEALRQAGVGTEVLKEAAPPHREMDSVSVMRIFENPEAVDKVVQAFNDTKPAHPISAADRAILKKDAALADAIFDNSPIKGLIADGLTTVAELHGKPAELLDLIENSKVATAIRDGSASVNQLARIPPQRLHEAFFSIFANEPGEAARLLGLDGDGARRFVESIRRADDPSVNPPLDYMSHRPPMLAPVAGLTRGRSG
jgi:hypothetical protein